MLNAGISRNVSERIMILVVIWHVVASRLMRDVGTQWPRAHCFPKDWVRSVEAESSGNDTQIRVMKRGQGRIVEVEAE
jgi:hypothetical protein